MMRHFRIDFTFPRSFKLRLLGSPAEAAPGLPLRQYPVELQPEDREGVFLEVQPAAAAPWLGFFALGYAAPGVVSGAFTTPHPEWMCVVSGGYAYFVNSADPQEWYQALTQQKPVVEVRAVPAHDLLLLASFTTVTAYGRQGLRWETAALSWEGLRLTSIEENELHGFGWNAMSDQEVPFTVDLRSGAHSGGARPGG